MKEIERIKQHEFNFLKLFTESLDKDFVIMFYNQEYLINPQKVLGKLKNFLS